MRPFLASVKGILALVFMILGTVFTLIGALLSAIALGTQAAGAPGAVGVGVGAPGVIVLVCGVAIGMVGLGLGARRKGELRELERLLAQGMACEGVVLDVAQNRRMRVNRRHPWVVRYRYQAMGTDYEGEETVMNLPAPLEAGDRINVVYDLTNPRRSALGSVGGRR